MNHWLNYFVYPIALGVAPVLGVALLAVLWALRQKRRGLALLGRAGAVQQMLLVAPNARRWHFWCLFLALPLLLIGSAGPRWGREFSQETAQESDLVIVLDVSRSMLAEQPSRQERSLRILRDLADHLHKHGGQRVALVVFAARPHLMFPLTHDYDHFRQALASIEAGDLPRDIRPTGDDASKSGTRIGAALGLAAKTLDLESDSPRGILLLSDGDDPARDDEWLQGVHAARAMQVPVYTVGIGDPSQASGILIDGEFLRHDDKVVKTRLEEAILRSIAERTGGVYLPAHTSDLPLGSLLAEIVKKQPDGTTDSTLAAIPVMRPRQDWFLWPALAFLVLALLLRDGLAGQRRAVRTRKLEPSLAWRVSVAGISFAMLQIGAAGPDEDWIRQANAAARRNDLDQALALYEKAEPTATDPGLVAFNKGAVLYRLKRYREAELHYLRCLDDDQAPLLRQTQALFGLGISLMRQAGEKDVAILNRAIDAFAACLQKDAPPDLTTDAQFNLELARWLRLKAGPAAANSGEDQQPSPGVKDKKKQPTTSKEDPPKSAERPDSKGTPQKGEQGRGPKETSNAQKLADKLASPGPLHSIPDTDTLRPLPPEDTAAYLEQLAKRILHERRTYERRPARTPPELKDW